jgi:hypothetical protein
MVKVENDINAVLDKYRKKFNEKVISDSTSDSDILMNIFGLTHEQKLKNMQYWGRELGKCWEAIVQNTLKLNKDYGAPIKVKRDEVCDCQVGNLAIDAKYRVGSGDSGTLKKFIQYGEYLQKQQKKPVFLFLREDNLHAAITAAKRGGWEIIAGDDSFEFIKKHSGYDLKKFLESKIR